MVDYLKKKKLDRESNPRKEIEITMEKGTHLSQDVLDWYGFHFPETSTFDGFLQICYRGRLGFRTLWTGLQDNMEEFLSKMKIISGSDYYITANYSKTIQRKKEHLFAMQNIVIDIDCHEERITKGEKQELLKKFRATFEQYTQILPLPHSIVWTGRGLQLWWAIEPIHADCLYFYTLVKHYFIHCLEYMLREHSHSIQGLMVDHVASNNAVGVFRLPGTNNPKARTKVSLERTSVKEPYRLQALEEILKKNKKKVRFIPNQVTQSTAPKQGKMEKIFRDGMEDVARFAEGCKEEDLALLQGGDSFTYFRTKQLLQLFLLRGKPKGAEERNNFCLLVYSALRASFSHEESWQRLQLFNQKFKQPLTLKELENVICSAQYKEGYRFTNKKVIEFLCITSQEKDEIGLYAKDDSIAIEPKQDAYKKHFNKVKKELRNKKIKDLFSQGNTAKEIAQQCTVSVATVNRVTGPERKEKKLKLLQEIRAQLDTGIPFYIIIKNIPFLSVAPKGTVYNYRDQALALSS